MSDADRARLLVPPAVASAGAIAAMVGVSAGAVPQPGLEHPVWYGLVALVVGYWSSFIRLARAQ